GRSHLGEAALLLAALWPSGGPAAVQGTTVQQVPLRQRHRRSRLRRSGVAKVAIAAVVVAAIAGTFLGVRFTKSGSSGPTLPSVTGVSPVSGTTVGGNTVTINGTGLGRAAAVRFGGVPGTIISDSDTRITVTSPPRTVTAAMTVTTAVITGGPGRQITG